MNKITKIACRTVGTLGMGVALYDACKIARHHAKVCGEETQTKNLERIYFSNRTTTNMSYVENDIAKTGFDVRSKNPLFSVYGNVKGAIGGFLYGLGVHLPAIACSAFAILGKGWSAKIGAIGLGLSACIRIAKEGFGIGKENPMK